MTLSSSLWEFTTEKPSHVLTLHFQTTPLPSSTQWRSNQFCPGTFKKLWVWVSYHSLTSDMASEVLGPFLACFFYRSCDLPLCAPHRGKLMIPVTNDDHLRASCGSWDTGHLLEWAGNMLRKKEKHNQPNNKTLRIVLLQKNQSAVLRLERSFPNVAHFLLVSVMDSCNQLECESCESFSLSRFLYFD